MIIEEIKSNKDQLSLELAIIEPRTAPVGIVQILHGMAEHKERYYDFMNYLAERGFICAIHDHRGHGASVKEHSHLGYFYTEDMSAIVDDAYQVTEYLKNRYDIPNIVIFSHSMGTLVARNYLQKYDDKIDSIVMCGPPTENSATNIALALAKVMKLFYNDYTPNQFLHRLALGPYNKGYSEKNGWISSDASTVSAYNADPLCGFIFTTNGFINLFKLLKSAYDKESWHPKNNNLPIFLIAGEDDPVIQSKERFEELEKFLRDIGYKNTTTKLYKNKRHELLNELGRQDVYKDVLEFLNV